ncbi:MAG: hypothetical protein KIC78_11425 [Prevotella sp.]|uniref:hypothetical protein n=1 Tax=Prevotella sp. TaxID=59823 RepID=UPI00257B1D89|nr:hypothetical protein [Prevotella sp.]MBS5876766.1 hypothetical protein [Prevotella sp.]
MKTKLISMFLIVAILFSTSGCSNVSDDNVYQGEMKTEALKKLKNDLLVLNSNYENNPELQTRFKFKLWFRVLAIVVADVACTIYGNLPTGITASKSANDIMDDLEEKLNKAPSSSLKSNALDGLEIGSAGYIHNKVLIDMYEKYGESMDTLTTEQLLDLASNDVYNLTGEANLPLSKSDAVLLVDNVVSKMDLTKSISENIESLKTLTIDPELQSKLDICGTFIEGLQMVDDNDSTYFESANELIINSDLPTADKLELQDALSVGYASAKLWNTEVLEDYAE